MESSGPMTMARDYFDDLVGDCSEPYGPAYNAPNDMPIGCHGGVGVSESTVRMRGASTQDAVVMSMPADLWRLITTYLMTSDAMSLRCTAHAIHGHLKIVSDAVLEGCHLIDQARRNGDPPSITPSAVFDTLRQLRLEARCDILKRYARAVGMGCSAESGHIDPKKAEPFRALQSRYLRKRSPKSTSPHHERAQAWRRVVESTKSALLESTFDARDSIAVADLYVAEMYAPLLGVVADPDDHTRRVMGDAARLTLRRWMDFLYEIGPIKDICHSTAQACLVLAGKFDRTYPMPRVEVVASIVHASLGLRHPTLRREACLNLIGLTPKCVTEEITPRVTARIVDAILSDPYIRGMGVLGHLQSLAKRWDKQDKYFHSALHQSFLTQLAKNRFDGSEPWRCLSETVRAALCTQVLGIPVSENGQYGLIGGTILHFWGLYFEVSDTSMVRLFPKIQLRIDALPWPLQAVLYRRAAEVSELSQCALDGHPAIGFHELSLRRIDILCVQALTACKPRLAIPALQAALKWQVARACSAIWDNPVREKTALSRGEALRAARFPVFTPLVWTILEDCTVEQRLPLVASLFHYRDVLAEHGYDWPYEKTISENVIAFLCNPASSLIRPAAEVLAVLLHCLPFCVERLPEDILDRPLAVRAIAERFDIPWQDVANALDASDVSPCDEP